MRAILLSAAVGLMSLSAIVSDAQSPSPGPVSNELPRSWSLEEIAEEASPRVPEGKVYVLAWSILEDERPLRVESCLALKVFADGRYSLTHLYRRPDEPKAGWRIASTHVVGDTPLTRPGLWLLHTKLFKRKPTNQELYAALKPEEVNWKFDLENDWRYVGCGVCEQSWLAALGEKPTKFFGAK